MDFIWDCNKKQITWENHELNNTKPCNLGTWNFYPFIYILFDFFHELFFYIVLLPKNYQLSILPKKITFPLPCLCLQINQLITVSQTHSCPSKYTHHLKFNICPLFCKYVFKLQEVVIFVRFIRFYI